MQINKSGKSYYIEQLSAETDKQLIERSWFIVNGLHLEDNKNRSEEELKRMEKNARLSFNMNVLRCKYPDHIEKMVEEVEKKVFV